MSKGCKLNKPVFRQLERDIQKELNKFTLAVPVAVEPTLDSRSYDPGQSVQRVYNINTGDNAQISVDSQNVRQSQTVVSPTAASVDLKSVVDEILQRVNELELAAEDRQELQETAQGLRAELDANEPDGKKIKGFMRLMRRILEPIVSAAANGAASGTSGLVHQWVEQLGRFC